MLWLPTQVLYWTKLVWSDYLFPVHKRIVAAANGHQIYDSAHTGQSHAIPFEVAAHPLFLDKKLVDDMVQLGPLITSYMDAISKLYHSNQDLHEVLDHGKPSEFHHNDPRYLFIRPDVLITEDGLKICEIEVSPFGLALSDILARAYEDQGLLVNSEVLGNFVQQHVGHGGTIVYSDKTHRFAGQLRYLAEEVFQAPGATPWSAKHAREHDATKTNPVYRGYYLHETQRDEDLRFLTHACTTYPSPTPFYEEKAVLALIWDTRFVEHFCTLLGDDAVGRLRSFIPPTWIVGHEEYFEPGLPNDVASTIDIADLGKSKRQIVIKSSGFCDSMSWGHGVLFLDKISATAARKHLCNILEAGQDTLYIGQQYCPPAKVPFHYFANGSSDSEVLTQDRGCRITPYYAAMGDNKGELLTIKATGRNGSRYIHAATDSVNTSVAPVRAHSESIPSVAWR